MKPSRMMRLLSLMLCAAMMLSLLPLGALAEGAPDAGDPTPASMAAVPDPAPDPEQDPDPEADPESDPEQDPDPKAEDSSKSPVKGPLGAPLAIHTVTFVNGVTGATIDTRTVNSGGRMRSGDYPPVPQVEGYTFDKWVPASLNNIREDKTVTATYTIKTYTVTFLDEGGKRIGEQTVNHGSAATPPEVSPREGYTPRWSADLSSIKANTRAQLSYVLNTYTVTFINGVTGGTIKEIPVDHGSGVSATDYPEAPANEGYDFKSWNKTPEDLTSIKADTEVRATYTIKTYTVTFLGHDGAALKTQTVDHGSSAAAPTAPARVGYSFAGWDGSYDNVKGNISVTALYEKLRYTVLFRDWNGAELKTQTVEYGGAAEAPEAPVRPDYTFAGWEPADFTDISGNLTVTARYTPVAAAPEEGVFTVTFRDWDGRVIDTQRIPEGESAAAPADPEREGFKFLGWDADFSAVSADMTVRATYEELFIFFVTVHYQYADGSIANEPFVSSYKKGDRVTDIVTSPQLRGFTASQGAVDFTHITSIDSDHSVTVVYTPSQVGYTVRHMQETLEGGWAEVEADRGHGEAPTGQTVTRSPNVYPGFTCTTGDKSLPLGPDEDNNIIEFRYARNSYLLIFDTQGGKYIAPVEYKFGAAIDPANFPTPERAGWIFDAWSSAAATMPAQDVTVSASWTPGRADYTIIHMIQNTTGTGYEFESAQVRENAVTDSQIVFDASTLGQKANINSDYRAYFTYKEYETGKTVAGDGSTVVYVYYTRNSYTVNFVSRVSSTELVCTNTSWMHRHSNSCYGTVTTDTALGSLTALYEADIESRWPYAGSAAAAAMNAPANHRGWTIDGVSNEAVSKRLTMTADLCDTEDGVKTAVCTTSLSSIANLYYMFEDVVQNSSASGYHEYNYKSYSQSAEYSQMNVNCDNNKFEQKAISGFTPVGVEYNPTSQNANPRDNYLYYDRNAYELTILNGTSTVASYTGGNRIKFGASLSGMKPADRSAEEAPAGKEGWVFTGWYTNSEAVGEAVDFDTLEMPARNLILYAGWAKPDYTVTFDLNDDEAGTPAAVPASYADATVIKGDTLEAPDPAPQRMGYEFLGWYSQGMRYIFGTEVHGDLALIAQWRLRTDVPYTVYYVFADDESNVFDPKIVTGKTTGESVLESARAYIADNGDLYLPNLSSATLTLQGDEALDVITFKYRKANSATFTVKCLDAASGETLRAPETITEQNIDRGYITYNAPVIPGYTPTKYQETVYYATEGTTITFYYTKNSEVAYQVRYFFENLTDSGYTEDRTLREPGAGPIGGTATKTPPAFTGFAFNADASTESIRLGHDAQANIIRLYYDRKTYTVTYEVVGGNGHLELGGIGMSEKVYAGIKHGTSWADAAATAPQPVGDDGFMPTAWTPDFPEDDTEFAQNYVFQVSFVRDDSQYYKVTYDKNAAKAPDATGTMPVDDNNGEGYVKNSTYTVKASGFDSVLYAFTGWNTKADGSGTGYQPSGTFQITADTTLYAQWTAKAKFSVTYHGNEDGDGRPVTGTTARQEKPVDQAIEISANGFTNPGYAFAGWNTKADGTGTAYASGDSYSYDGATVNLDLYAQWTKGARYRVLYDANWPAASLAADRSGAVPTDATEYLAGEAVTAKANTGLLAVTGYSFLGWATSASATAVETGFAIPVPGKDLTLYAVWQRQSYGVRFLVDYLDEAGYVAYAPEGLKTAYYYNETLVFPANPTALQPGYSFTGWQLTGAAAGTPLPTVMGTEDLEFRGSFTLNEHLLRYWVAANGGKLTADYGQNPNQTAVKAYGAALGENLPGYNGTIPEGYLMSGWYMDEARQVPVTTQTMPDADEDLYAAILPRTDMAYRFEYYTQPVTAGVPTATDKLDEWKLEQADAHNDGTTDAFVTAPQLTFAGYTFSAALSDTLRQQVKGDGSLVIRLYYTADRYTVTYRVTGAPDGVTAPVDASSPYYEGATVTAKTAAKPLGYTFTGWTKGTETVDENATFLMGRADVLLEGAYTQDEYTVVFKPGEHGSFAEKTVTELHYDDPMPEAPDATSASAAHYFAGWALEGTTAIITLPAKVTGNATYVAQWLDRGTITVTPGDLTLVYNGALRTIPADSVAYTYDATLYRVSGARALGARTVVGDTDVTLDLSGIRVEKRVGTAWTDVTADPDAYDLTRGENGTLRITPAPAAITVGNYEKGEGEADPVFTAEVTGLYGNDTIPYTLTRTPGETAGQSYPITITYTPNRNYNVTTRNGLLAIVGAPPIDPPVPPREPDLPPLEPIDDEPTALAGPGNAWALLNLLLAILTVIMSVLLLIGFAGKKQTEDKAGVQRDIRKHGFTRAFSLVPALGAVIAFLLTENMRNPMVFTDRWTLLMAVIALAQLLVVFMARKKEEEPDKGVDAI